MNIIRNLSTDLKMKYVSPSVEIYEITSEGLICGSNIHQSFNDEDSWLDLVE